MEEDRFLKIKPLLYWQPDDLQHKSDSGLLVIWEKGFKSLSVSDYKFSYQETHVSKE